MAPIALSPPASPRTEALPECADAIASYKAYDHVHWYVGNAKQAAAYYVSHMGFERIAYRGLETGSRTVASHVVRNGDVTFVLSSPLRGLGDMSGLSPEESSLLEDIHGHLERHGDAVRDVAFEVDSVPDLYAAAVSAGAHSVREPRSRCGCAHLLSIVRRSEISFANHGPRITLACMQSGNDPNI